MTVYKEFMEFGAQYLMQYEMIKYAKANNFKQLNFYGIDGDFDEKIAEVDAKLKAAKTPKDADDAVKAEYNEKRKALRAEKKKLEMDKVTSIHKAESLERGADTYCDVFTLLTGKLLDVRKTPRINPYTPLTEEEELEVLNSLWANKSARRAPKKKA